MTQAHFWQADSHSVIQEVPFYRIRMFIATFN